MTGGGAIFRPRINLTIGESGQLFSHFLSKHFQTLQLVKLIFYNSIRGGRSAPLAPHMDPPLNWSFFYVSINSIWFRPIVIQHDVNALRCEDWSVCCCCWRGEVRSEPWAQCEVRGMRGNGSWDQYVLHRLPRHELARRLPQVCRVRTLPRRVLHLLRPRREDLLQIRLRQVNHSQFNHL